MAGDDVTDLVAEHGRQLRVVLRDTQDAPVDADMPARQREGVDLGRVEDDEIPARRRDRRAAGGDDPATHRLDPLLQLGIVEIGALALISAQA